MRLSAITWYDGYQYVIGRHSGGNHRDVTQRLTEMKEDGAFPARCNPQVIRLPRRYVLSFWGGLFASEAARLEDMRQRLQQSQARYGAVGSSDTITISPQETER